MPRKHIHFVTGHLAAPSLRKVLAEIKSHVDFDYSIGELGITVAALLTPAWVARKIDPPAETTSILLPGCCLGDLAPLAQRTGLPIERGPKDLRDLPHFFGQPPRSDYGHYNIEILAEINHAPGLSREEILRQAAALKADGADIIDVGCNPGETWGQAAEVVRALREAGHRVSIDSYNPAEIEPAVRAGAELVLSVNHTNRLQACDWGCEVVVVPDQPRTLNGLEDTLALLERSHVPVRIDPILEPIGFGFAASLERYGQARQRWPQASLLMGIGNLTELTDADSAGINLLLLGLCQELGIRSVLTTQVINWSRTAVRECDLARRLVYHAVTNHTLPKHVEPRLVMLRDPRLRQFSADELSQLAEQIRDHSYRLFAEAGKLHLMTAGVHLTATDAFDLFKQLLATEPKHLDVSHAFYLGYELAKATTALTLHKNYRQDEALEWGFLTVPERSHRGNVSGDQTE